MKNPRFEINLSKIYHNVQTIVKMCKKDQINIVGVTKGVCANPEITSVLVEAGVTKLADSRMRNILELRKAGFTGAIGLLRIPMISEAEEAVQYTNFSYQSELRVMEKFNQVAAALNKIHQIILMVDVGDLREGVLPQDLDWVVNKVVKMKNLELIGLGMNVGCYGGVIPSFENTSLLIRLRDEIVHKYNILLPIVSGGSSSSLMLMEQKMLAPGVNEIRVGEALYLGTGASAGGTIPGAFTDAFKLVAEIIELKDKPSVPIGVINKDAFGRVPNFENKGIRKRAILAIGQQDVSLDGLIPMEQGVQIIGASSDHLILDISECRRDLQVGDEVAFLPNYGGLMNLMTSPYVTKITKNENIKTLNEVRLA